jgi:translation initiation factor IF-2
MEEKKKKKKKLTLSISSSKTHNVPRYTRSDGKTSVVIEKKAPRRWGERKFQSQNNNINKPKLTNNFVSKKPIINKNFDIRRMAEERATRRFETIKEDIIQRKKSNLGKEKHFILKRENKLTLSKALDDEAFDGKERSLASVKRARLKEKKNQDLEKTKTEIKKVVREVNIPNKISIQELSNRMAIQASGIIKHLLEMGVVATINHTIDADTAEYLVKEFGNIPIREKKPDLNIFKPQKIDSKNLKSRPPIVTIMGHVDHGKT